MRAVSLAVVLLLAAAAPAAAQSATARMSASVSVVEPVTVEQSALTVSEARGGGIDVTRPLSVRGRAPWVLEVRDGDVRHRPRRDDVTIRIPSSRSPRPLVYTISLIS